MVDDTVEVKFGGDPSGIEAGAKEAGAAVDSVQAPIAALQAAVLELSLAIKSAFTAPDTGLATEMKAVEVETERETALLAEVVAQMHEAAAGVLEFKEHMIGLGEIILAVFAVEQISEWVSKMAEASEHAEQLGEKLGMTQAQVQGWGAVATLTGRQVDTFTSAMTRLVRSAVLGGEGAKQQSAALKDLGIAADEALHPNELMLDVAQKFAEMGDGPGAAARKIADSMALMGRSGADMIPILDRGRDGIEELIGKGTEYGVVLDEVMNRGNVEAAEKLNEMKLAVAGLATTIFTEIAPAVTKFAEGMAELIKDFKDGTKEGGSIRTIFNGLAAATLGLAAAFGTYLVGSLVACVVEVIIASNAFRALALSMAIAGETGGLAGVLEVLGGVLVSLAEGAIPAAIAALRALTVAMLANPVIALATGVGILAAGLYFLSTVTDENTKATRDLSDAQAQLKSDSDNLSRMTEEEVKQHKAATQAKLEEANATLQLAIADAEAAAKAAQREASKKGVAAMASQNSGQDVMASQQWQAASDKVNVLMAQVGTLNDDLNKLNDWKPPKVNALPQGGAKKGPGLISQWTEELHATEVASGDFFQDQTAAELAFWQSKLGLVKVGTKEWLEVQTKIYDAEKTLAHAAYDEQITSFNEQLQAATGNAKKQEEIENAKVAFIRSKYGDASKEYQNALREQERMVQQHAKATLQIIIAGLDEEAKVKANAAKTDLEVEKVANTASIAAVEERLKLGQINAIQAAAAIAAIHRQQFSEEMAYEEKVYELKAQALESELELLTLGTPEYEKHYRELEQLYAEHQSRMRVIAAQASAGIAADNNVQTNAIRAQWQGIIGPSVTAWGDGLKGMAKGTETFAQAWQHWGDAMLDQLVGWVEKQVETWLIGEITKTGATATGVGIRVTTEAAGAAATTTISTASALAQIAGHAAVAAAGAYAAIAGIPIIGPILAPIVAAGALVAVLALGRSVFSAEGGWDRVPYDGAMTELHKDEMVLSAPVANVVRSLAEGEPPQASAVSDEETARDVAQAPPAPAVAPQEPGSTSISVAPPGVSLGGPEVHVAPQAAPDLNIYPQQPAAPTVNVQAPGSPPPAPSPAMLAPAIMGPPETIAPAPQFAGPVAPRSDPASRSQADAEAAGSRGPVSFNINAIDRKGVRQFFEEHGDSLVKVLNGKTRDFAFAGGGG